MNDDRDDLLKYGMLLIHISFLAYSIENNEPMAVKADTIEDIIKAMAENDQVPQVMIDDSQEGYIKFGTLLVNKEEEDES